MVSDTDLTKLKMNSHLLICCFAMWKSNVLKHQESTAGCSSEIWMLIHKLLSSFGKSGICTSICPFGCNLSVFIIRGSAVWLRTRKKKIEIYTHWKIIYWKVWDLFLYSNRKIKAIKTKRLQEMLKCFGRSKVSSIFTIIKLQWTHFMWLVI